MFEVIYLFAGSLSMCETTKKLHQKSAQNDNFEICKSKDPTNIYLLWKHKILPLQMLNFTKSLGLLST